MTLSTAKSQLHLPAMLPIYTVLYCPATNYILAVTQTIMYRVLLCIACLFRFPLHIACIACLFVMHRRRPDTVSFSTPIDPTREMISVDTRSRGVLPQDRKSMTIALTGDKEYLHCRDQDYFPLTFPLLLPHGKDCGWHPDLVSTTGRKITMLQWVTQLLLTESRFQRLGPVVNEFLIDVFSCIEDERLAFHANNQDKYTSSLHNASGQHRLPRHVINGTTSANRCVIPASCTSGFAHKAKKATEGMAILRHLGPPDYFITMTCNKVNPMLYLPPFASPHKTVHDLMSSLPTTSFPVIHVFLHFTVCIPTIYALIYLSPLCASRRTGRRLNENFTRDKQLSTDQLYAPEYSN